MQRMIKLVVSLFGTAVGLHAQNPQRERELLDRIQQLNSGWP